MASDLEKVVVDSYSFFPQHLPKDSYQNLLDRRSRGGWRPRPIPPLYLTARIIKQGRRKQSLPVHLPILRNWNLGQPDDRFWNHEVRQSLSKMPLQFRLR